MTDWKSLYELEVKRKKALEEKYERDTGKKLTRIVPMAQPEQEPVGRFDKELNNVKWKEGLRNCDLADQQPFYTTPPQRTWVGLTDEEANECWDSLLGTSQFTREGITHAIEAKLKEKNT